MIKAEFGFGGLEAVLDSPAMAFYGDQGFDAGAGWAPRAEERVFTVVGNAAPD